MKNKLNNCLLGGAVGDALGLPFEGLSSQRVDKLFKDKRAYNFIPWVNLGMVSDDTEHAPLGEGVKNLSAIDSPFLQ